MLQRVFVGLKNTRMLWLVLALLLLLELSFRLFYFGLPALWHPLAYNNRGMLFSELPQSVPEPMICYRLKPNLQTYFRATAFNTNQHGFRERSHITRQPPPNTLRIAILGRSVSMGSGITDEAVYSRQLEHRLTTVLQQPIEVLNFAVGGYRYQQVAQAYELYVKPFQPDIILWPVYYGELGRVDPGCRRPEAVRPQWDQLRGYLIDFFIDNALFSQLNHWRENTLAIDWYQRGRALPPPPTTPTYEQILQQFILRRQQEHIPVILVALPLPPVTTLQVPQAEYPAAQAALKQWVATHAGVGLIDTGLVLAAEITPQDAIYLGDFHPNSRVHQRYAEEIARQLAPRLTTLLK